MTSPDQAALVVLGESLAAGLVNFSLHADDQRRSFPHLVARQLGLALAAPLFEPPGVGDAIGFPRLPVLVPHESQTTVLAPVPAAPIFDNIAIPGLTLAEALARRPAPPLVHRDDAKQTAINYILGAPALMGGAPSSLPTQLEYAVARRPALAIVELGFAEAMEAAVTGRAELLPPDAEFREGYDRLVSTLRSAGAEVIVTTIPDPADTAACATLDAAGRVLKMPAAELRRDYRLEGDDRILVAGLVEIGVQIMASHRAPLPAGSVLPGAAATAISARVRSLNAAIVSIASQHGAAVADFAKVYQGVATGGAAAGSRTLSGDFLGGFFSLNGYTPGAAGQAMLANAVIEANNATRATRVAPIDVGMVVQTDAVAAHRPAAGPAFRTAAGRVAAAGAAVRMGLFLAGFIANMIVGAVTRKKDRRPPSSGNTPERWTLRLPPAMMQVLPLDERASYYGDALTPVHTTDLQEQALGLTGRFLFGGLGLIDSHLRGKVKIRFFPPVNNVTHFEVTHPGGGLKGGDTRLTAPVFFKLAAVGNQVMDSTSHVSSGDLNLVTGEVTNLQYALFLLNSAILALAAVNPTLPKDPIPLPGEHGRAWARFDQRPDGLLDYTCYCASFIPLSVLKVPIRFPLPFTGPSGSVASIPGDGTALHPHFSVSTRPPQSVQQGGAARPPIGEVRHLETAAARWQVQYGTDFGGAVSVSVRPLPPAGVPRVRVEPAADDLMADDRLNLPVGAIDTNSGSVLPPQGSRLPAMHFENGALVVSTRTVNAV